MIKNILYISIIAMLLIVSGCEKSPAPYPDHVSGQVLEIGTRKPIKGALVLLLEHTGGGILSSGGGYHTIDAIRTDSAGSFKFVVPNNKEYYLSASSNDFREYSFQTLIRNPETVIELVPKAILAMHIVNVNPYNESDTIRVGEYDFTTPPLLGRHVDTTLYGEVGGNSNRRILWAVVRNGKLTVDSQLIYIPGHKTTLVEIKY